MSWQDLAGSTWAGTSELWLDPLGNTSETSPCTVEVAPDAVRYTWAFRGTPHQGTIAIGGEGGVFTDSFHSPVPMVCRSLPSWALADLAGTYTAGEGPPWGWRLTLSLRPPYDGGPETLVLQMTNVAPWGEETRAVRVLATRT